MQKKDMAVLGFTEEANEAAMKGELFVHNGDIYKLDKELTSHSLKILKLEADVGVVGAVAAVHAHS